METLADFGTVAVFNYDTFTTAIYKSWFGFFSLQAAAQLASLLLLFVGVTLFAERRSRGHGLYVQGAKLQHLRRFPLSPVLAGLVSAYCALVLAFAFVLPMLQSTEPNGFWVKSGMRSKSRNSLRARPSFLMEIPLCFRFC